MEIEEMYQEVILDHYRRPRNNREIKDADIVMEARNPLCGDEIKINAKIVDGCLSDISFIGSGCAISQASASMLTDKVKGLKIKEFHEMMNDFSMVLKKERDSLDKKKFGNLVAMKGVAEYPARVKCALLAWHALNEGILDKNKKSTTI